MAIAFNGLAAAPLAIASGTLIASLAKKSLKGVGNFRLDAFNMFSNIATVMYTIFNYYFYNPKSIKPAAVIAGIPLGTVSEISHAMSDRILKYRATGGIFLAHQEGGEQTLRIMGKAVGTNRYMLLTMLDILFLYGSAKRVDMFADKLNNIANVGEVTPRANPWKQFDEYALDTGKEEKHLTFPVITSKKVYTNMYIETWEFTESIENGMNTINYSIFFRKYIPHFPYTYAKTVDEQQNEQFYYSEDIDDSFIRKLRFLDTFSEFAFSTSMIMYRFFQYLQGNSIERTIAHLSGLELNTNLLGADYTSEKIQKVYDIDYDLQSLSISQKEELMAID